MSDAAAVNWQDVVAGAPEDAQRILVRLTVEYWPITRLNPYPTNPKKHTPQDIERMASAIRTYGFRIPLLARSDGEIIDGHLRLKAALSLGLQVVPVTPADDMTEAEVTAFRLVAYASAHWAALDMDLASIELGKLRDLGFDTALTGLDDDMLMKLSPLTPSTGLTDEDDIPEPPEAATTRPGDLWILGGHRLLCGSSSSVEDVDRLVAGAPIHLVNTDPPYNVKVEPRSNNAIAAGLSSFAPQAQTHHQALDLARHPEKAKGTTKRMRPKDRPLANDFLTEENFDRMLREWFGNASRVLLPGRGFYIWGGYANLANYPSALKENGLYFSQAIVWDKEHPVLTRKDFMGAFEIAFYGWKEGAAHVYFGPNNARDLWHVKKVNPQSMVHLTEKPVELARLAMEYSSRPGENVLELFGGSGSTLMGGEQIGRNVFAMELDDLYCDVIVMRWQNFTGRKAVLEGDGRSFEDLAVERKAAAES